MFKAFMIAALCSLFAACSSDPEPMPKASAPAASKTAPAAGGKKVDDRWSQVYSWPAGSGASRDLNTDINDCTEAGKRAGLKGLVALGAHSKCMQSKGWAVNKK